MRQREPRWMVTKRAASFHRGASMWAPVTTALARNQQAPAKFSGYHHEERSRAETYNTTAMHRGRPSGYSKSLGNIQGAQAHDDYSHNAPAQWRNKIRQEFRTGTRACRLAVPTPCNREEHRRVGESCVRNGICSVGKRTRIPTATVTANRVNISADTGGRFKPNDERNSIQTQIGKTHRNGLTAMFWQIRSSSVASNSRTHKQTIRSKTGEAASECFRALKVR